MEANERYLHVLLYPVVLVKHNARLCHIFCLTWKYCQANCELGHHIATDLICAHQSYYHCAAAQVSNIFSWWCSLSFGATMCWADWKLILSDGMSIYLTFVQQGKHGTLAARTECMYRESTDTQIKQNNLPCHRNLQSQVPNDLARPEGRPALQVTDVWYLS